MRVPFLVLASLLVIACAHRPSFREVLASAQAAPDATQVQVLVLDPATRAPLPGVGVAFGDGRQRTRLKTGPDGVVTVPVTPALLKENPLVEVSRSTGGGYLLTAAPAAPAAPAPAAPVPAADPPPTPAAADLDGGISSAP